MKDNWLVLEDVSFGFDGRPVIRNLTLQAGANEPVIGIVGRSGVGKSTLLSLIAGFEQPWSGSIRFQGEPVTAPSPRRPVVFQDHNLLPWKTVEANIALGLKAMGMDRTSRQQRVAEIVREFDLAGCERKYPEELSGGMRQRVGLARAMVVSPECLIMDEPFGALDEHTKNSVRSYFREVVAAHSMCAVHVTHDIEEAVELCTKVILLQNVDNAIEFRCERDDRTSRLEVARRISAQMAYR